ncbi:DivIVA domain-containing protein [Microbacterium sp. RU33B]|uniref:DivIVA domain-containing protein n=1 Tax=Microbacterium sp. RU33B TaxID=1907390 RepID=UPI0009634B58|nr:DivIVA domain-containing protein [Microbacterium sp. RU33B]SIT87350.1 DivIVA domain-containing protein [Microbacterium sp. RU33B]
MTDQPVQAWNPDAAEASPFDELISRASGASPAAPAEFATAFRGYDKDEVDAAISGLTARLRAETDEVAAQEERLRRIRESAEERVREAQERADAAEARADEIADELAQRGRDEVARLEGELAAASARASVAENQVAALTEELSGASTETANRHQFDEVLRVAEEQGSLIIKNATVQADRLLEAAREEILNRRKEAQAEADSITARAQHDAQQVRLRIDTELTAHQSQLERESAHAAEKVSQAEQEAAAIRSEAEKGAAALRSMVARETSLARSEAEEAVRELRVRALEFEESLTRRQDDAQQEFLVLHNQAVAHAERITQDANEQVASSLDHAQRVAAKADDFDRLMRAQAAQLEADARVRAGETLERARAKAEKIIDTVTQHSQAVLRDAEDRTRQLRWQQHQLTSFMAEVTELIRPQSPLDSGSDEPELAADDAAGQADDAAEQDDDESAA